MGKEKQMQVSRKPRKSLRKRQSKECCRVCEEPDVASGNVKWHSHTEAVWWLLQRLDTVTMGPNTTRRHTPHRTENTHPYGHVH
jgi:hypothetical protein